MKKILICVFLMLSIGCNDKPKDLVNKNVQLETIIESPRHSDMFIYKYEDQSGTYLIATKSSPAISIIKIK